MHVTTPVKVTICCLKHHQRRLSSIADKFGETWAELVVSRKVDFTTQDMVDMQRAEMDTEWTIALRVVENSLVIQGLIYESLKKNTPFYHPLMASMFRQVEESRRRLILAGLIYAEPLPPPPPSDSEDDVPPEARPGLPRSQSRSSANASRSITLEPRFEDLNLFDNNEDYNSDDEDTVIESILDDNLPSNEELGINP
ncbi:hypothetical protein QBC32DRAFT_380835 [Pseudoneurospora amorphoporcata]|uniref:Uncharacterized protein n=1 Tax=Pseudoneurospora amorphoporcata TaxID=241081 RepID=A0AAN6SCI9_9PEZI|nr:hypothetical protein QBC32DRAFT_380835 [Pseudoneurospora amorphoporcata]